MTRIPPVWRLLLAVGLLNAMFFIPTAIAYYGMKGANIADFFLIQGIFKLAVLVLEIPTGYIADRWRRTTQMVVGAVVWTVSLGLLFMADSFTGLIVAELVGAVAVALHSGTVQAYLHELLRADGKLATQPTWQGRLFAVQMFAETLAGAVGGLLFAVWLEAPVVATIGCGLAGIALMMRLPHVPRDAAERRHTNPWADLGLVVHHCLRVHDRLPFLLIGPAAVFGLTGALFWAFLAKLTALGVSATMLGVYMALYMGVKTLLALAARRFHTLAFVHVVGVLALILAVGGALMLSNSPWVVAVGGIMASGIIHAVGRPLVTTLVNAEVPDHERATVLSVGSMLTQMFGGGLLMAAHPLTNLFGLEAVVAVFMGATLLIAGYPLWRLSRV